MIFMPVRLQ